MGVHDLLLAGLADHKTIIAAGFKIAAHHQYQQLPTGFIFDIAVADKVVRNLAEKIQAGHC